MNETMVKAVNDTNSDVYFYWGPISKPGYHKLSAFIENQENLCDTACLILTTYGGDPDAAYRIARALGDIARIYFYMDDAYPGHGIISKKNRKLFEAWAKEDPVDGWERAKRIEAIQGNYNKFAAAQTQTPTVIYHGNIKNHKFHRLGCRLISRYYNCSKCTREFSSRDEAVAAGYSPCGVCKP